MVQGDNDNPQPQEVVIRIREYLERWLDSDAKNSWTIDQVPENWRKVHNNAFVPEMISIGHFISPKGVPRQGVMEEHKKRFLNRLLGCKLERSRSDGNMSRTTEGERESNDHKREEDDDGGQVARATRFDDLVKAMQILAEKTRACYSKTMEEQHVRRQGDDNFVMVMVVDGSFVVELLRLYYLLHTKSTEEAIKDDPVFTDPRILTLIRRDLLLLENQLPFFVLEKLYELINKMNNINHQRAKPLEVLAITFFNPLLSGHDATSKLRTQKPVAHLLDLIRSTYHQPVSEKFHKKKNRPVNSPSKPNGSVNALVLHFASELQEAGVQFKKRKGYDLLDIEFDHRTLWVPPLSLNDNTICLLLNFVAYELSVNHPEPFFTNYFMFWDSLVNSPRDLQILHKHGIINNLGSEEEVAKLLTRCREVIYGLDLGYLYDEIKEVNDYCERYRESKYHVWWRSLIREHFSSPWTCLSLFAATILLLLTALQTIYTVYPYYRQH